MIIYVSLGLKDQILTADQMLFWMSYWHLNQLKRFRKKTEETAQDKEKIENLLKQRRHSNDLVI